MPQLLQEAVVSHRAGKLPEAEALYSEILQMDPDRADAQLLLGTLRFQQGRDAEALRLIHSSLQADPRNPFALYNYGNVLLRLKRYREAAASYEKALEIKPDHVKALNNLGATLKELKRYPEALACYGTALAISPNCFDAHLNRGIALRELGHHQEALASYDRALAIKPGDADALSNRGSALHEMRREADALTSFEQALAIKPDHPHAFGGFADCARAVCDWTRAARVDAEIDRHVKTQASLIPPLTLLSYRDDPALQLKCAGNYIRTKTATIQAADRRHTASGNDKIRLGYFSGDFRHSVVASVIAELLERHDRAKFEVLGISFGPDDNSQRRARMTDAVDQFHDVRTRSDSDVAELMQELGIDIAIDLTGYTWHSRTEVLAYRPCPVQVSYLGYPGTTGATFIDYILADEIVLPFEQQQFFTENIVHLPDCYLPNDLQDWVTSHTPTRAELGLPEHCFVFCAFTKSNKITVSMFEAWMRLLRAVDRSVLWLSQMNELAVDNLRREAATRGTDPDRLIFAPRLDSFEDHLARHRQADLFLDTLPYNAHTTAANALWAGLPVLTCKGNSFAGRVGASLLRAAGLPELVAESLERYEALALKLASESGVLTSIRHKLQESRLACPLFNSDRFRRAIEAAYLTMWNIHQLGEPPRAFHVAD